jgi:hypothetical protein
MERSVGCGTGVFQHINPVVPVMGVTHGGLHRHGAGNPGDEQHLNGLRAQKGFKPGGIKRAHPGFDHHGIGQIGIKIGMKRRARLTQRQCAEISSFAKQG